MNPVCTCNFAKSKLLRNKTDKVDAALVALYLKEIAPPAWTPPTDSRYELQQLTRRILSRKHELTRERNRLQDPGHCKAVLSDIKKSIRTLENSIQTLEKAVAKVIHADPTLRAQAQLLCSIDGIGDYTAAIILAELPPIESFKSASQAVAYAGLSPRQVSSGSSLKARFQTVQDRQPIPPPSSFYALGLRSALQRASSSQSRTTKSRRQVQHVYPRCAHAPTPANRLRRPQTPSPI